MLLLDSVCMREDMPLMIDTWFKSEPSVILLDDTCIAAASISTDTSKDLFRRIHSVLCTARFRTLQPHENTQEDRRFYKTEVDSSNSKFRYQHFFNPHGKSKHIFHFRWAVTATQVEHVVDAACMDCPAHVWRLRSVIISPIHTH